MCQNFKKRQYLPKIVVVCNSALAKEQINEPGGAHPRVRIGVGENGVDERKHHHLRDWVLADARLLSVAGPPNVAADKQSANEASNGSQQNEWDQFEKYPRLVVLDVEKDRVLVSVRIDGADDESRDQGAKE